MEIPIAFPATSEVRTFIISDVNSNIRPKWIGEQHRSVQFLDENPSTEFDLSSYRGSASVSVIEDGKILTTSPIPDDPCMLAVTLLTNAEDTPNHVPVTVIHLDLGSETRDYQTTVKAHAFQLDDGRIQLTLIDNHAFVITLNLCSINLTPEPVVQCFSVGSLLDPSLRQKIATSYIRPSMLLFLSPTAFLVSLNPFLLAIDIQTKTVKLWSKTVCLEQMKARKSKLRIVDSIIGIVTGGSSGALGEILVDMTPVSAMIAADNDASQIFTLHSDGAVRRWVIPTDQRPDDPLFLRPWEVYDLPIRRPNPIPSPEKWSDDIHSTAMAARIYRGDLFALSIYIQTSSTTLGQPNPDELLEVGSVTSATSAEATDATQYEVFPTLLSNKKNCCHLLVMDGSIDDNDDGTDDSSKATHCIVLQVPDEATSMVGMSFDSKQERGAMKAIFQSSPTTVMYVTYPPSNISIVYREPIVEEPYRFLHGVAMEEYDRIAGLSFYRYAAQGNTTLDDILHDIDCRFLQFLFRPSFPRGTGSVLPPSAARIRRALQRNGNVRSASHISLELQVPRVIHELRKRDNRRQQRTPGKQNAIVTFSMTPVGQRKREPRTPGTNMAYTEDMLTPGTKMSIYEALELNDDDDEEMEEEHSFTSALRYEQQQPSEETAMSPMKNAEDEIIQSGREIEKECKLHEHRWRQLLLDIWEEEEKERVPLVFFVPPKHVLDDNVIIVRPGCISVITESPAGEDLQNNSYALASLDKLAMKVLQLIENRVQDSAMLKFAEQYAWDAISRGHLAVDREEAANIEEKLKIVAIDAMMEINSWENCKEDVDAICNLDEKEILRELSYEPMHSSALGLPLRSPKETDKPLVNKDVLQDYQLRLAASSLVIRTTQTARRLFLGRLLVLSELIDSEEITKTALKMYLHSGNVLWATSQLVPLPFSSDAKSVSFKPVLRVDTESPPKKRPSFGAGLPSILIGSRDKTTALDSQLIYLSKQKDAFLLPMQSLSALALALGRVGIGSILQFRVNSTDQSIHYEQLPELGVIHVSSGVSSEQPKLIIRLLAPFVALRDPEETAHIIAVREEVIAECLLEASRNEISQEQARKMILRAFKLLQFDEYDLTNAMHRIQTLTLHSSRNPRVAGLFIDFVSSAIKKLDARPEETYPKVESFRHSSKLWSILFSTAISVHNWETAYEACLNNPDNIERIANSRRLVTAMVDAGALSELQYKCSMLNSSKSYASAFERVGDLYGIAAEVLTEMSMHDFYSQFASKAENPPDYQGALYSLHVAKEHWKDAALALDLRYVHAKKALVKDTLAVGLSFDEQVRRENMIVEDLATSAIGCYHAMLKVPEKNDRFLVSGEIRQHPSVPIKVTNRLHSKRGRGSDFQSAQRPLVSKLHGENRLERFMTISDIEARGIRSLALKTLFNDNECDSAFVKSAFADDKSISDQDIVSKLFDCGHYKRGLMLAGVLGRRMGAKPNGYDPFYNELCHLITAFLVPIATTGRLNEKKRPTLIQLQNAIDGLSEAPALFAGTRSRKLMAMKKSAVKVASMSLIRQIVLRYVSAETPIAVDAAESFLLNSVIPSSLPTWLEQVLLKGLCNNGSLSGSFSLRRNPGFEGYLGDPQYLLNLYIHRGLYSDACRVVCEVLDQVGRRENAPNRLPEKGEMDFIPYNKIDLLWNLIDDCIKRGDFQEMQRKKVADARADLESSLEKHFSWLKISEAGKRSARALS